MAESIYLLSTILAIVRFVRSRIPKSVKNWARKPFSDWLSSFEANDWRSIPKVAAATLDQFFNYYLGERLISQRVFVVGAVLPMAIFAIAMLVTHQRGTFQQLMLEQLYGLPRTLLTGLSDVLSLIVTRFLVRRIRYSTNIAAPLSLLVLYAYLAVGLSGFLQGSALIAYDFLRHRAFYDSFWPELWESNLRRFYDWPVHYFQMLTRFHDYVFVDFLLGAISSIPVILILAMTYVLYLMRRILIFEFQYWGESESVFIGALDLLQFLLALAIARLAYLLYLQSH
jgi:hypothetical protein